MNAQITCPELNQAFAGDLLYYRRRRPAGGVELVLGTVKGVIYCGSGENAAYITFNGSSEKYSAAFLARMPENEKLVQLIHAGSEGAKQAYYAGLNSQPKTVEVSGSTVRVWPKQPKELQPELTMCED